jgi:hypothetical protein
MGTATIFYTFPIPLNSSQPLQKSKVDNVREDMQRLVFRTEYITVVMWHPVCKKVSLMFLLRLNYWDNEQGIHTSKQSKWLTGRDVMRI